MEDTIRVVQKINSSNLILQDILNMLTQNNHLLAEFGAGISSQQIDELERIGKDLEFYRNKLEKNIIEVAFVGLEKAGKSTLVNAIISRDILPSDYKRATYTTTQIEYSPTPYIEISFYTQEEFLKEVFRKMLKDIEYPNYESQTLDTVSIRDFEAHFQSLRDKKPEVYKMYESNLKNDIIEILEGKEEIKRLLNGEIRKVPFEEFDRYRQYIVDKHKSRAVKEVKIFTDILKGLENIVIYDLPGFDSPTFTHSKFTKEKIKRADAVVFVREAENPSIRRPEVEMIQETREDDGVRLKDKIFYFCNMVDKLPDKDALNRVKHDFYTELKKYDVFKYEGRVVYGSALAKLQKDGMVSGNHAINGLLNLGIDDGIQDLLDRLREYNQKERRQVLLRRIDALTGKVYDFAQELYEKLEDVADGSISDIKYTESVISIIRDARQKIKNQLKDFHYEIKQLLKTKQMSENIKKQLEETIQFDNMLTPQQIEDIKKEVEIKSSTTEIRPDDFNVELRNRLYNKVLETFYTALEKSIDIELNNIRDNINTIFLKAFDIKSYSEREFIDKLGDFYSLQNINFSSEKFGLNKLIERFGGDIIQLLIQNPLTSTDRHNKFKEVEAELYSLIAYHKDFNPEVPPAQMPVIRDILYQLNTEGIQQELKDLLEKLKISLSVKEYSEILKLLLGLTNPMGALVSIAGNKFIKDFSSLKSAIQSMMDENAKNDDEFYKIVSSKRPKSYDDVLNEIKVDMENLRKLLLDCVVNAINIEKMIVNQVTSYINMLTDVLDRKEFEDFVNRNIGIIKPELTEDRVRLQTKQILIKQLKDRIEQLLKQLKEGGI